MLRRVRVCSCRGVRLAVLPRPRCGAENWPQWRGPGGQGVSTEQQLPTDWAPDTNIAWKPALPGPGHSSPIVWGDRAFVTAVIEGDVVPGAKAVDHMLEGKEFVHPDSVAGDKQAHVQGAGARRRSPGRSLWEHVAYDGPVYDARHRRSSFAGPTPATDGKLVYAYFGPEGLYAYDFNGKLVWKVVEKFPTLGLGTGTSPVLYREPGDHPARRGQRRATRRIVAYDKTTGKEVWRIEARRSRSAGRTPVLVEAGGRTELVTNGNEAIIAYDPATGKELWRTKGVESNAIHTPLVGHGLVIVTAGYPGEAGDRDPARRGADDKRVAWEYAKGTGYVLSNILYGDYLYLLTDNGIVTCLDAADGRGELRGRPRADAGAVHGLAGRVRRLHRDDQRGRRHVHAEGRPEARDRRAPTQSTSPCIRRRRSPTAGSTSAARSTCLRSGEIGIQSAASQGPRTSEDPVDSRAPLGTLGWRSGPRDRDQNIALTPN